VELGDTLGYDPKVGPAAADREEEVWVRRAAAGDDGPGCCHDGCLEGLNVGMGAFREVGDIPA